MGFYFRKSARFGPFRVNFSKSGVGVSVGVPGFRIGTGPRGNYVQAGAHGFYYRAAIPSARTRSAPPPRNQEPGPAPQSESHATTLDPTLGAFQAIESGSVERMVDSSSEVLLEEIRQKHSRIRWWPVSAFLGTALAFATWSNAPPWAAVVVVALASCATLVTFRWDLQRKLTILHYELNPAVIDAFTALIAACTKLQSCQGIWHLKGRADVLDGKYHAGASTLVSRAPASVGRRLPPYMISNVDPIVIALSKITLYCFPDRILVYRNADVGAVTYSSLGCESRDSRFIEDGSPPSDAKVVDHTWRYVNKGGGPDRRFNNNRQLAVCLYDELALKSGSGLNEILQLSRASIAFDFVGSVKSLAAAGAGVAAGSNDRTLQDARAINRAPGTILASPAGSQVSSIGGTVIATVLGLFAVAGGILLYFYSKASESSPTVPPAVITKSPPSSVAPHPTSHRNHHRTNLVKTARAVSEAKSSVRSTSSSEPSPDGDVVSDQVASPSVATTVGDDLAVVRAKDSQAAVRIESYCRNAAAAATDASASKSACHRDEIDAWTRLVVNHEFPNLDPATIATCRQAPFPDSYEGEEACAKYELRTD